MTTNAAPHSSLPPGYSSALAKCVLSGDTVVLYSPQNMTETRTVTLAWLNCPRLGYAKKQSAPDQPWAFEARETLRQAVVGREVIFAVEYTIASSGRDFCTIKVKDSSTGYYVNVASILLAAGHAKLRDARRHAGSAEEQANFELEHLQKVEDEARANSEGIWDESKTPSMATLHQNIDKPVEFVKAHKGSAIKAVVEHVRDGACVRARLMLDKNDHYMSWIYFSGINVASEAENGLEFNSAKTFVETRLLQRDVQVYIESQDSHSLVASVLHPKGNIAEFLLREGLARTVEWSLNVVSIPGGAAALRAAEKYAQERRLNIWANANMGTAAGAGPAVQARAMTVFAEPRFKGTVLRVISPEMILVQSTTTKAEHRISFSSIRAARKDTQEAYIHLGREWLRTRLIGKIVDVAVDFVRPPQNEFEERICAQVFARHEKKGTAGAADYNVAEELVRAGLACVLRYRRNEDQRASNYDNLLAAEDVAIRGGRGLHSTKPVTAPSINKISESHAKAKQFLGFLQNSKNLAAVVEHVISGSRLVLLLPGDSMRFTMVLSGIRAPRQGEKYSQECFAKTIHVAMQRNVKVEIESLDKTAAFVGNVVIEGANLATILVKAGLASVHAPSAHQNAHGTELFKAENAAKAARIGIWTDYDPAVEKKRKADEAAGAKKENSSDSSKVEKKLAYVVITEYVSPFKFFIHSTSDSDEFEEMMQKFGKFHTSPQASKDALPKVKRGDVVSAKYSVDNQWYRAKVLRLVDSTTAHIIYYDYGNTENVPISALRALPAEFTAAPAKAHDAVLSYVKQRDITANYSVVALERFCALTRGKRLIANIDRVSPLSLTLFDPETAAKSESSPIGLAMETSINTTLLADGCAILDERALHGLPQDHVEPLREAFHSAKENRRCMWQYGNIDFDEEAQPNRV